MEVSIIIQEINIKLDKNEALVLFELLSRINESDSFESLFEDQAEQKVLLIIEGDLQKKLDEIFMPNYIEIIQKARDIIRDPIL